MRSEIEDFTDFSIIRYAQCWEDADILLEALSVKEGGHYISIASAGDNSFALLAGNPRKVTAVDLNENQLYCVELRKEAYRSLSYEEFLYFTGITNDMVCEREKIYLKLASQLTSECQKFWNSHLNIIRTGFFHVGKFEHYFHLFRTRLLPLIHTTRCIDSLFEPRSIAGRVEFYYKVWNNRRWRLLYHIFFSKFLLGKMGRDKAFFHYVDGSVASRILRRTEKGFFEVPMDTNSYLHYVLYGNYDLNALPFALRRENFEAIKRNIDCLEIRCQCLEEYLEELPPNDADGFNLSDIFEYMSEENMLTLYQKVIKASKHGARVAYWNMLVARNCPRELGNLVSRKKELSKELTKKDKAFFYSRFIVEEVK